MNIVFMDVSSVRCRLILGVVRSYVGKYGSDPYSMSGERDRAYQHSLSVTGASNVWCSRRSTRHGLARTI